MQTTTIGTGTLEALLDFCLNHSDGGRNQTAASLAGLVEHALQQVPKWSASLQPLQQLANTSRRILAGIDIEATGKNTSEDRIVELSAVVFVPGGDKDYKYHWLLDPGRPIPAEATAVHGHTDEDVAGLRTFADVAKEIADVLHSAVIVAFNGNNYDVPLLLTEFNRAGIQWPAPGTLTIDPRVIYVKQEGRGLADAMRHYCYQDGETAHRSEADTYQALHVLAAQLERYPELSAMTIEELDKYCQRGGRVDFSGKLCRNDAGAVCFAFGKNKDQPVAENTSYAYWMLRSDFPEDTKEHLRQLLKS